MFQFKILPMKSYQEEWTCNGRLIILQTAATNVKVISTIEILMCDIEYEYTLLNFDSFMIMENNLLLRIDFIEALLLLYKS